MWGGIGRDAFVRTEWFECAACSASRALYAPPPPYCCPYPCPYCTLMVLIDHQVSPSIASGAGGQTLSVTGANFLPDAPQLTCRFGALATAPARFVTPSLVLCAAPAHADGAVALAVANNGADFRALPLEFVFAPVPVVDAVSPLYANPPLRSSPPPPLPRLCRPAARALFIARPRARAGRRPRAGAC